MLFLGEVSRQRSPIREYFLTQSRQHFMVLVSENRTQLFFIVIHPVEG